jgi:hypothetical protein
LPRHIKRREEMPMRPGFRRMCWRSGGGYREKITRTRSRPCSIGRGEGEGVDVEVEFVVGLILKKGGGRFISLNKLH